MALFDGVLGNQDVNANIALAVEAMDAVEALLEFVPWEERGHQDDVSRGRKAMAIRHTFTAE